MIRIPALSALALALLAGSAIAHASTAAPAGVEQRFDNRQERQAGRIAQGVESGEITRREQLRLNRQQQAINKLEARVEVDGIVTRREAFTMEKAQDRASRAIAHASHDPRSRRNAH